MTEPQEAELAQIGQATARLLHEFRNQLGGLKLYASYLQKRLADNPAQHVECLEITGKMLAGLNVMAEHAVLVGRLARPVELDVASTDIGALLRALIVEQDGRAVLLELSVPADLPRVRVDAAQLRVALQALLRRACEMAEARTTVTLSARALAEAIELTVTHGGALSDTQLQSYFAFLTSERLNPTALEVAHAQRVIAAHGGTVDAANGADTTIIVTVRLPFGEAARL